MGEITVGSNPEWTIPALDFAGVPTGIDIRLVVETGIAPAINTGIAHRQPGVGQVGAGVVRGAARVLRRRRSRRLRQNGWRHEPERPQRGSARLLSRLGGPDAAVARHRGAAGRRGGRADDRHAGQQGASCARRACSDADGEAAGANDLIIAVRAECGRSADAAHRRRARLLLDRQRTRRRGGAPPRAAAQLCAARCSAMPDANLALISVPGDFAAAEARKALRRGLNVMIFSDNVPLERGGRAQARGPRRSGCCVMGPDCGTAIIAGAPLALRQRACRAATSASSARPAPACRRCRSPHRRGWAAASRRHRRRRPRS